MRCLLSLSRILLAACISFSATAAPKTDKFDSLAMYAVAQVCLAQNLSLSQTPIGRLFAGTNATKSAKEHESDLDRFKRDAAPCLESRQWLSTGFCEELLNKDPSSNPAYAFMSMMQEKYPNEASNFGEFVKCTHGSAVKRN